MSQPNPEGLLRTSCQSCRQKKIKCTRDTEASGPCRSCLAKGLDCVYGLQSKKGRPKKTTTAPSKKRPTHHATSYAEESVLEESSSSASASTSSIPYAVLEDEYAHNPFAHCPFSQITEPFLDSSVQDLAEALARVVLVTAPSQGRAQPTFASPFLTLIYEWCESHPPSSAIDSPRLSREIQFKSMKELPLRMVQQTVNGASPAAQATIWRHSLYLMSDTSVFTLPHKPPRNPLLSLQPHDLTAAVTYFFENNALAPLLSDTLFFEDLSNGTVDEALLAAIVGMQLMYRPEINKPAEPLTPDEFFNFAKYTVFNRHIGTCDRVATGMVLFCLAAAAFNLTQVRNAWMYLFTLISIVHTYPNTGQPQTDRQAVEAILLRDMGTLATAWFFVFGSMRGGSTRWVLEMLQSLAHLPGRDPPKSTLAERQMFPVCPLGPNPKAMQMVLLELSPTIEVCGSLMLRNTANFIRCSSPFLDSSLNSSVLLHRPNGAPHHVDVAGTLAQAHTLTCENKMISAIVCCLQALQALQSTEGSTPDNAALRQFGGRLLYAVVPQVQMRMGQEAFDQAFSPALQHLAQSIDVQPQSNHYITL